MTTRPSSSDATGSGSASSTQSGSTASPPSEVVPSRRRDVPHGRGAHLAKRRKVGVRDGLRRDHPLGQMAAVGHRVEARPALGHLLGSAREPLPDLVQVGLRVQVGEHRLDRVLRRLVGKAGAGGARPPPLQPLASISARSLGKA